MAEQKRKFFPNDIGAIMTRAVKHVEGEAASIETATVGEAYSRRRMPIPEEYGSERNLSDLPQLAPHIF